MVRCVHTCSHIRFIVRFMVSEGGDPLCLPFTSKTEQSHSVAQNRQTSSFVFFFFFFTSIKGHILAFYNHNFRLQTYRIFKIELNE